MIVGTDHHCLPGLGRALIGRSEGERIRVIVPAERAYGAVDPGRVWHLARARFAPGEDLTVGRWVPVTGRAGRRRRVRVLGVDHDTVTVDANHPWAGQAVALDIELVAIHDAEGGAAGA
jgi:FKBP-type peptidyl-prolyl cis-trans isomerase 2